MDIPMDSNLKLGELYHTSPINKERYQHLVGKLIYLSHTRSKIALVVSVVSQFICSPCEVHLEVVYRILKYLKETPMKVCSSRRMEVGAQKVDIRILYPCLGEFGDLKEQEAVYCSLKQCKGRIQSYGPRDLQAIVVEASVRRIKSCKWWSYEALL